jgi:hypothetical protein
MYESQRVKDLRIKLNGEIHKGRQSLVEATALRHTILNLGQNWPEVTRLEELAEDDETYKLVQKEYKSWLKDSRKEVAMVVKAKLPLTLESTDMVFHRKGPFAEGQPFDMYTKKEGG